MQKAEGPFVLGIDCGTQSLHSAIFDVQGHRLGAATRALTTSYPRVSWAEQEAESWWEALCVTVPEALANAGLGGEQIGALSVSSASCTVVACRRDGTPLRPAIMWMDQRAHAEARRITLTQNPVLEYVSWFESPEWMIPKTLWLRANEPQVYGQAERIVEAGDWLRYRLVGDWTASVCNATAKWNYAQPAGGYPRSLLATLEAEELLDKWPSRVLPLGAASGELSAAAAQALGLRAGTPVAQGGIDAYASMLGSRAAQPGRLAIVMGTSTCHLALTDREIHGAHVWGPYPDALLPGTWVLEGGQTATGSILAWAAQNFAGREQQQTQSQGLNFYHYLDQRAAEIPAGAEGLVLLDYWQGNRTPLRDPLARGAIWGLSLKHTLAHVWRAILEGTAMGTRHIIEDMAEAGFEVNGLYACGRGAASDLWLQIHADVMGQPLNLPQDPHEAAARGTAICAAVGAGLFPDLVSAARSMVTIARQIEPQEQNRRAYEELFRQYIATYPALRDLMHQVARSG